MRIFTASLASGTNTFSPVPTDINAFMAAFYAAPGKHPETPTQCSSVVPILRRRGKQEGFAVIEGTSCWAELAGPIQRQTYETLRDRILAELTAALPVDAVVLGLHGAMVAQGYDDPEGDLLTRIRDIVGPDVLVAAEFDPHSHLTALPVAKLDLTAAFLEFPHTDFEQRGEHVVELSLRALRGEIRPVISTFDCRMITIFPTSREPMRSFVDRMKALEGNDGILSASVIHGFMAGDVPDMGTRIVVVTDSDKAKGDVLAAALGRELYALRKQTAMPMFDTQAGLDRALVIRAAHPNQPVTIADIFANHGIDLRVNPCCWSNRPIISMRVSSQFPRRSSTSPLRPPIPTIPRRRLIARRACNCGRVLPIRWGLMRDHRPDGSRPAIFNRPGLDRGWRKQRELK
jgi:microcystin degradation protein MlrC